MDKTQTDKVPQTQTEKVPQTGEPSKNSEQPPETTENTKKEKILNIDHWHGNTMRKLGMKQELWLKPGAYTVLRKLMLILRYMVHQLLGVMFLLV